MLRGKSNSRGIHRWFVHLTRRVLMMLISLQLIGTIAAAGGTLLPTVGVAPRTGDSAKNMVIIPVGDADKDGRRLALTLPKSAEQIAPSLSQRLSKLSTELVAQFGK